MIELAPKTIGAIPVPKGYERMSSPVGSFASWLRTVPLKTDKTVYLYNGQLKPNQEAQFVVVNISTGKRDLQQCADVVMRFRAEYLFAEKNYADIAFMDYKGKWYKWQGVITDMNLTTTLKMSLAGVVQHLWKNNLSR